MLRCVYGVQFDSGLHTTAVFVDSAYKLAAAAMSTAPMSEVSQSIDCSDVSTV